MPDPKIRSTGKPAAPEVVPASERASFRRRLLGWYEKNQRTLPWRGSPTPYGVWVSEVMLQQTRVEVVRDYYQRWMAAFPSLEELARANESDVLHLWQGLGYYSRARRLVEGARFVLEKHGGKLPETPEGLLEVPGIGPYSAGAISSIAFHRRSAIVDGNVIRVLSRHFALDGDPNKQPQKARLWALAGALVPEKDPGTFNQSLMELGATICTPKSPMCHVCPLVKSCKAFAQGRVHELPQLPKRKPKTALNLLVLVLVREQRRSGGVARQYGFVRQAKDARWWAQMDVFPFRELSRESEAPVQARLLANEYIEARRSRMSILPPLSHSITRFDVRLLPVVMKVRDYADAKGELCFIDAADTAKLALPSAHRKVLRAVES